MKQKASILAIAFFLLILNSAKADCFGECDKPFYGMSIDLVSGNADQLTVTTTGAIYIINSNTTENPNRIVMQRRIDPATNTIDPKTVAVIEFQNNIGSLKITSSDKRQVDITSPLADFNFMSDSFFTIKAKAPFTYTHTNLIQNASWNKGSGLDRMWTDGYGGSLHAWIKGNPEIINPGTDTDHTKFSMKANDEMAHMVFPPKTFDFEGLYGQNARPFVYFISDEGTLKNILNEQDPIGNYKKNGFGVFFIWNSIYETKLEGREPEPQLLTEPSIADYQILGYKVGNDLMFRQFIDFAHDNGFKVITYLSHPDKTMESERFRWQYPDGQFQDISITRAWMKKFQEDYELDGWYFDNANVGDLIEDYNFIRQVREDVDTTAKAHGMDKGIIFHHDSVDIWDGFGAYRGLRAIMIDAYVDYTVTGETGAIAEVDDPNNPYFRFFTAGYGMSQAYASHIRKTDMKVAISEQEKHRVLAENLNGVEWGSSGAYTWASHFKPFYDKRKETYLSHPDVYWPINTAIGWFRYPTNVQVQLTGTLVRISWETNEPADSEVAYTSNGAWWKTGYSNSPDGPDGTVEDESMTTKHNIVLPCLKPNTPYEFRIRSNNQNQGLNEIIWGYVGNFNTSSGDSESDGMQDCWETKYFGNLNRDGTGDFDGEGLTDLQEFNKGTDPTNRDTDFDGSNDFFEIENKYNPFDWNSPEVQICNNNNICQKGENTANCPNDCKEGLLAYWSFDYGELFASYDQSGNNYNGEVQGAKWVKNGGYNRKGAYEFNGSEYLPDYISVGSTLANISAYGGENGKSTITAWVKPSNVSRYNVITHHLGGFDYFSAGTTDTSNPGKLRTMVWVGNENDWPASNEAINQNEWTHVAFVFEGGKGYKIYINGMLDPNEKANNNYALSNRYGNNAYIGYGSDSKSHFAGMIDEVTVWKRALSQEEILEIYTRHCGNSKCEPAQGETTENCPLDCTQECVDTPALMNRYIPQWKSGAITMLTLMQRMKQWNKAGCPPA